MKNNQDIKNYYKGEKVAHEIIDIIKSRSSFSSDNKQLHELIASNDYSQELIENLTNEDKIAQVCAVYKREEKLEEAKALKVILDRKSKTLFNRKLITISASSVAAVISVLFLLFNSSDEAFIPEKSIANEHKMSVPTLILSNGESVDLVKIGDLKSDLIEKKGTNKISYKSSSDEYRDSLNTIIIPSRFTYSVVLEDGTEVLLNAGSEFRYPVNFKADSREVYLHGEAFFRVSKSAVPFIVKTNEFSVKVYGTQFNINTNNQDNVQALLVEGSVGITANGSKELIMTPNQMFTLDLASRKEALREVKAANYLGWTVNLFKCEKEQLYVVLNQLAQWYNVEFKYKNKACLNYPITITLSRSTDLENILKAMEVIIDVKFVKESKNKYVVE